MKGAFNHNYNHDTIKMRRFPYAGGKMPLQNPKKLSPKRPAVSSRRGKGETPVPAGAKKIWNSGKKVLDAEDKAC